jgi:imidazolonepropionase-like amidohydrolase
MSLAITGATIIDGAAQTPIEGCAVWIEAGRIKAIAGCEELRIPSGTKIIDGRGKYVIPGLMNANVHLLTDVRVEVLARYMGRYEELIAEAAQVALKNGLTTVFDTWGPRRFLMTVRDQINEGTIPGSRIFCAGNIAGFDGPLSQDFDSSGVGTAAGVASAPLVKRINAIWVENVGRQLMWQSPEQVAQEIRAYISKGVDFIKYASNDHFPGAFLAFSPRAQAAIVEEAHRAGIMAQAHTMSGEGLRVAVEAGCDLIQHANITGPIAIPEVTLELMAKRRTPAVVFPWTRRGLEWIMANASDEERTMWAASDTNVRNLIGADVPLLLANDGGIFAPEISTNPQFAKTWGAAPEDEGLLPLGTGHFVWFRAMEEKGCPPMEILKAATRNVAVANGKGKDLGTLEVGKIADLLILNKNPLHAAENYSSIHMIIKDGVVVDREALPVNRILTKPMEPPAEEEASYKPFIQSAARLPFHPICRCC